MTDLPAANEPPRPARTLVLGLGNPILTDDAVGLLVVREVARKLAGRPDVVVREGSLAGFEALDQLAGFQKAVVVDAIKTASGKPGVIHRLSPESLPTTERLAGAHEVDLPTALALGHKLGWEMPAEVVVIFAIEIEDDRTFGEACTPAVAAAIGPAAARVVLEIGPAGG